MEVGVDSLHSWLINIQVMSSLCHDDVIITLCVYAVGHVLLSMTFLSLNLTSFMNSLTDTF